MNNEIFDTERQNEGGASVRESECGGRVRGEREKERHRDRERVACACCVYKKTDVAYLLSATRTQTR